MREKRGQLMIFVIIAVVIVAGVLVYLAVSGNLRLPKTTSEYEQVYNYYSLCIEQETREAIDLAGSQGGYVYVKGNVPGSEYAPFSSHLNFLGFPVPYWYYISGNGLIKEQIPSKRQIESEVERYVKENLGSCDFENYYAQGFEINFDEPEARVRIEESRVKVDVNSNLVVTKGDVSGSKEIYSINFDSNFGKFYDVAREIYDKEKKGAFLENYSVDVLRLYAPIDGVEISCAPAIWKTQEIIADLKRGLEGNIAALRLDGKSERKYFNVGDYNENINLIYSQDWPTKIEIEGDDVDADLMITKPIGNQRGLGIMGFCYSPYHFVYDLSFPVLIQVYNDDEIFQFPVVVIVDNNLPREKIYSEIIEDQTDFDVCQDKVKDIRINLFDIELNRINGNISYRCFNQDCKLGETESGVFVGKVQQCVNGNIVVNANGYAENTQRFSSNSESVADIILEREYEEEVKLEVGGRKTNSIAIISFSEVNGSKRASAVFPENTKVKLSEGYYEISVYVYGNSSIVIPASTRTECREVPRSGILGVFGARREECFDITIPETKIDTALIGGGKTSSYILPSDLERGRISIGVDALPVPNSLEQLANNFEAIENGEVKIEFG